MEEKTILKVYFLLPVDCSQLIHLFPVQNEWKEKMEGNKEPECDTQPRLSFDIFPFLLSVDVFLSLSLSPRPEESVINLAPVTHSIVLIQ